MLKESNHHQPVAVDQDMELCSQEKRRATHHDGKKESQQFPWTHSFVLTFSNGINFT